MKNIVFHYLYRDGANYKNLNSIVFDNNLNIELTELADLIGSKLICGEWFYANQWNLPDLHFGTWDSEIDHDFHEFEGVEYTDEPVNTTLDLTEFITTIKQTPWQ